MKKRNRNRQADLFDTLGGQDSSSRVQELDELIRGALRKNNYDLAKKLTLEQEKLIQELVERGEMDRNGPSG